MSRTVVIRPVSERSAQEGEPVTIGSTAYRIELPNGEKTGTGLFVTREFAEAYAAERGWLVTMDASAA